VKPSASAYALVLGVALAASATSLANGFVFDDVRVVQRDARVHSLGHLRELLDGPYWSRDYANSAYRPATSISFALDWAAGGGRPVMFHATNVLLHLAVVALVLSLASLVLTGPGAAVSGGGRDRARGATGATAAGAVAAAGGLDRAGGARRADGVEAASSGAGAAGAVVAALWFAVQPVHVEVVANVVGRSELLAAAGYLAALLAYVRVGDVAAGERRGLRSGVLVLAVLAGAAIAFGAKEHALTLPAVLVLADMWRAHARGEAWRARLGRNALLLGGVLALAAGYLAARAHVVGGSFATGLAAPGLAGASIWARMLVMAPAVLVWLEWLILPLHLSADYLPNAFVPRASLGAGQIAGFLALGALVWAAVAARRRAPGVTLGIVWLFVTAAVAANIVFPTGVILGERLAYLPSVGAAIALGALWQLAPASRLRWPLTVLVLALLAARTLERIPVWHDQRRFLAALVRDAPDSYRTHWGLGAEAFKRGQFAEGEREMQAAIRINPADAALIQELGERYLEAGLFAPAARYFEASYRLDSLRSDAAVRAAFAWLKAGRPDSAAAVGAAALRRAPNAPALLITTGEAYLDLDRPRDALALARRLVLLAPDVWWYEQSAGYAAARCGRCDEARERLERAVRLAPEEKGPAEQLRRLDGGPACGLGEGRP
jgi:tetratricopeptide (TPR) repeat protein